MIAIVFLYIVMNLAHLRYFLALAETGNFTRAAERVFVAQPTLSAAVAKLEADLGVTLVDRAARRVSLTPEGQRFRLRAAAILAEWQAAQAEARPGPSPGRVVVAVSRGVAPGPVAAMLAAWRAAQPDEVRLLEGDNEQVRPWLARGRAQLAILPEPRGGQALYRDRIVAAMPHDHPLARKPRLRPGDLEGAPLVVWTGLDEVPALRRRLDRMGVRPQVVARPRDAATAMALVAGGLGLCLVPDSFVDERMAYAEVEGLGLARRIVLQPAGALPERVAALARFAADWPWRRQAGPAQLALAH